VAPLSLSPQAGRGKVRPESNSFRQKEFRPHRAPFFGKRAEVTWADLAAFGEGRRQPFALPDKIWKSAVTTGMLSANALPDAVWQSVQLQV
jgi:hypothetical protein